MPTIQNYPHSLTDEHHAWHEAGAHPEFPTRSIPPGAPGSGLEFLAFHRDFIAKFHAWYDPQPFANQDAVRPWTEVPPVLKRFGWDQALADAENRIVNRPSSFASADELGLFIETTTRIHDWLHGAAASAFNEPILSDLHSNESTYFYQLHGLIDNWWARWEASRIGIGSHFYTTSESERDNAINKRGFRLEGIACYTFETSRYGDRFYTTSPTERDNAVATFGYTDEGTACYVFDTQAVGTVPLYRLANRNGYHFYTASASERDSAVANHGFTIEGIACYVSDNPTSEAAPLYRLRNNTNHFYTTSISERDNAIANHGFTGEGIACYVFTTQAAGTTPLYRLVNTQAHKPLYRMVNGRTGDHFYTTSEAERDNAITNLGYTGEGTACYVFDSQIAGTMPLYRMVKDYHFYTASTAERDNAIANLGYTGEGNACYVFGAPAPNTIPLFRMVKVS